MEDANNEKNKANKAVFTVAQNGAVNESTSSHIEKQQ